MALFLIAGLAGAGLLLSAVSYGFYKLFYRWRKDSKQLLSDSNSDCSESEQREETEDGSSLEEDEQTPNTEKDHVERDSLVAAADPATAKDSWKVETPPAELSSSSEASLSSDEVTGMSSAPEDSRTWETALDTSMTPSKDSSSQTPPPTAPKPRQRLKQSPASSKEGESVVTTSAATSTVKEKIMRSPNAVLVMPEGLAQHIASRSKGRTRGSGETKTSDLPPERKRQKLTPQESEVASNGATVSHPLSGGVVRKLAMNGASEKEDELAVSFEEPTQSPKLAFPSRNKGPNRRPPTHRQLNTTT